MRKPFMVEFTGTPEAGKTTAIGNVADLLSEKGYQVKTLSESAEKLPQEIPKGTSQANLWMHYQTQAGILKAQFFNADIVLIDRGLVDSNFYGKKFLWENVYTKEEYEKFRKQFMDELFPDFLVALTVAEQASISRRGGEGRLVNMEYLKKYNAQFYKYYDEIEVPKTIIDTTNLNVAEMNKMIFSEIVRRLP